MEESVSSVMIHSRKRKKSGPSSTNSNPNLMGVLTRRKSRIVSDQNHSGISMPDPVPSKTIPESESAEALLDVNCGDASRIFSIKDLRMKRVFTPDVNPVPEEEEEEKEEEEKNEARKKVSEVSGFMAASDVDELEKSGSVKSKVEDKRNDMESGLNLKYQSIPPNWSLLKSKMAPSRCRQRKVFKTSSSFSYRRLLPHLMDIVNDASSVSKIEIVDAGIPSGMQKLDGVRSEVTKIESMVPQFHDSTPSENLQRVHIQVPFFQLNLSGVENKLAQTEEISRQLEVVQKGHKNDMNGVDALAEEEHIQMTPPDPGIFTKTEVGHGRESMEAGKVVADNQTFMGLSLSSEKSNGHAMKQSPDSNCSSNSMNGSLLNPCSQLRLFKNARSLSYKRLLPFLMDMSKKNSCALRKTQHPLPLVVPQEDIRETSAASAEHNYLNKIRRESSHEKQHTEDLTQNLPSSMVTQPPADGSSPDTDNSPVSSMPQSSSTNNSSNVKPSSVASETLPHVGVQIDLQTDEIPQIPSSPTASGLGLESKSKESSSTSEPSSIVNSGNLMKQCPSEEPLPVGRQKKCLNMGLELHNSNAESIEKVGLGQTLFQIEASGASISSNNRPPKGILKRNQRGCRGLCNCLNCASFRLHADRAFEFSQNQMHDAEEVALDLVKELENLRLLLEKSISKKYDSAGIQLDPILIKKACNKALEAENLAKERLSEMNYDLSVHCRIPALLPPKVSFGNNIQERAIPVLNPPSSTEKEG